MRSTADSSRTSDPTTASRTAGPCQSRKACRFITSRKSSKSSTSRTVRPSRVCCGRSRRLAAGAQFGRFKISKGRSLCRPAICRSGDAPYPGQPSLEGAGQSRAAPRLAYARSTKRCSRSIILKEPDPKGERGRLMSAPYRKASLAYDGLVELSENDLTLAFAWPRRRKSNPKTKCPSSPCSACRTRSPKKPPRRSSRRWNQVGFDVKLVTEPAAGRPRRSKSGTSFIEPSAWPSRHWSFGRC